MTKKRGSRKKTRRKYRKVIVILFLVWFAAGVIQNDIFPFILESIEENADSHIIPVSKEWNLIVVNRWNEIPEDFSISLTELSNGQKVDSRIYPYLQEMFDEMRADGIYPIVREGYRTAEEQEEIFNEKVQVYMNEGYFRARAERLAKEWVALPGTSEHQLGIAVDINADKAHSANDEVYEWLAENAYKYGFILRYPQGKEEITGTEYEPWHYRYVGVETAEEIFNNRICLEEYFGKE
ncbi:MAG: M15 family metallopeptidase [Lachnospiraceae bacterium]|nr:M15 family metallopeptidase [Lachnospiraceae bacterium]